MTAAVEQLEREFAAWLGAAGAVGVGFGRAALALAFEAARVRDADVLVPNFICAQVPEAVRRAGGHPVFYTVGRDLAIDPQVFRAAFTPQTRAAIVPHYFGRMQPHIEQLAAACRERRIPLVEDCALALGASRNGRLVGTFGDAAVFSFTKSDWCYGGGIVACKSLNWLQRMREIRTAEFRPARWLAFCYGLLRRADCVSNRPSRAALAEFLGRWMERVFTLAGLLGSGRPSTDNFYDAGRFDSLLAGFAARRARSILRNLPRVTERRRALFRRLAEAGDASGDSGDACSFVLMHARQGNTAEWLQRAAACGVTLRVSWPAYQPIEGGQGSEELLWHASRLLILEVHPDLTLKEMKNIIEVLQKLKEI